MSKLAGNLFTATFTALFVVAASPVFAQPPEKNAENFATTSLRGRVVFLAEAMERLHGVKSLPDAKHNTLALESADGTLYPLVEDKIGHSFRLDERLMATPMELLVRKFGGSPSVQVIRIHTLEGEQKFLVDYWCDICSIPMYELKACDCCQGEIRLRKREVTTAGEVLLEKSGEGL